MKAPDTLFDLFLKKDSLQSPILLLINTMRDQILKIWEKLKIVKLK